MRAHSRFFDGAGGRRVLSWVIEYFHAQLDGAEHIPESGGALIVGNHSLFALDAAVLGALIVRDLGRFPRFLADRNLWRVPGLRDLLLSVGAVPGYPSAAERMLQRGELVIAYPGGVDDSLKSDEQRYQLQWHERLGFARLALRARVPIVPVVGLGIDEMYSVRHYEHWLGRLLFGSHRYDLPLARGAFGTLLPRRAPQRYVALPPVPAVGNPNVREDVEQLRDKVRGDLEAWLEAFRAERSAERAAQ
ncbi:MAG TPA: lysophospholipid acyltransferase family protein [Polyangiales bacterium]|jgi:1-acyl-sn-glycerol-3-phosphate acyltransferase|nr:lysophospholipid acyltransferase family protein [Polyangiales bacterium]